jgi:hypothetical protein
LHEDGHDASRDLVEVYDDPQPPPTIQDALSVEPLAAYFRVECVMIG